MPTQQSELGLVNGDLAENYIYNDNGIGVRGEKYQAPGSEGDPNAQIYTFQGDSTLKNDKTGAIISYDPYRSSNYNSQTNTFGNGSKGTAENTGQDTTQGKEVGGAVQNVNQDQISQPGYTPGQPYTAPNTTPPQTTTPPANTTTSVDNSGNASMTTQFSGPNLAVGARGDAVSQLQQSLGGLTVDGQFGSKTQAAVKQFQLANGLTADGIVGPQTMAALNRRSPSPIAAVAAGANTSATKTAAPVAPTTGNSTVDSLISLLNNQSPQKTFSDIYKEAYTSLGLPDMNASYAAQTKAYSDLQNEKNDKIQDINNNPWYSEGVRVQKLNQLDAKYQGKEDIMTNKLKLLETNITNARSDAQFLAGHVADQLQQSQKMTEDVIFKAIDIAEKEAEAEAALNKPVTLSGGSSLVNPKTGAIIKTAPKITSPSTTANSKAFVTYASSKLETVRGTDGYVDPYVYKEAYDGWVNGFVDSSGKKQAPIGTAAQFATKFPPAKYINPEASKISGLLPSFLQTKAPKTTRTL